MSFRFKSRASIALILLRLTVIALLLCAVFKFAAHTDVARADDAALRTEAESAVRTAQTPVEKINALVMRANLPSKLEDATTEDWKAAAVDMDEALRIVAEVEKDGQTKISQQSTLYFRRAFVRAHLKEYAAAIADYDSAEKAGYAADFANTQAKGSTLWNNRAQAKVHLDDYAGAVADYDRAIELQDTWLYRKNRALYRFELGDYDGAMSDWKVALEAHPPVGKAPFNPALAPLNKAVAEQPQSAAPLIERARFLVKLARAQAVRDKNFSENIFFVAYEPVAQDEDDEEETGPTVEELMNSALSDLDRAIKIEPDLALAWLERGRTRALAMEWKLTQNGLKFQDAQVVDDFNRATEVDSKSAIAWYELGKKRLKIVKADELPTLGQSEAEWNLQKVEKLQMAIANLSRAIYLSPTKAGWAHYLRAYAERMKPAPDRYAVLIDYGAAIEQKLNFLDGDPESSTTDSIALAEAHQIRGLILNDQGQWTAALTEFDAAIALNDKDFQSRFERAKIRLQRGEYDAAIADFDVITKARPNYAEAWLIRAGAYDAKGEIEKAKSDLKEAFRLDATLSERVAGSRYDIKNPKADVGLAPAPIKGDPQVLQGTALEHKNAGNVLNAKGDKDGALAEYSVALRIDPKFADAYSNRAGVYNERGEYDLALDDYNSAIQFDPKHRAAFLNRALTWRNLGEDTKERADFDRAIEYADNETIRAAAYNGRSVTRENAGDAAGALDDAKRATTLAPKDTGFWSHLGELQLNSGEVTSSINSYRQALQIEPDYLLARANLALALAQANDASATAELDKVLAKSTPEQVAAILRVVEHALKKMPQSATLQSLQRHTIQAGKK